MLAVYSCESCSEGFAVREGKDPNGCPFCYSPEVSWSHSVEEHTQK